LIPCSTPLTVEDRRISSAYGWRMERARILLTSAGRERNH
jgi:hypothetical protein